MPTPTYVAIAKTVLTGTQSTVTFSSISSSYTDLLLSISARTNNANTYDFLSLQFNGDTSSLYSDRRLYGDGSAAASNQAGATTELSLYRMLSGNTATANTFGSVEIYIPNYTSTTSKPVSTTGVSETNSATGVYVCTDCGLYRNTSAITAISIFSGTAASFVSGSRFDLYGIKNS